MNRPAAGSMNRRRRMDFGDTDPSAWRGDEHRLHVPASEVRFSRRELDRILRLYGRKVSDGEWRDYAIDFLKDRAVFSVFRRASEVPIYRIEKNQDLPAATAPTASSRRPGISCAAARNLIACLACSIVRCAWSRARSAGVGTSIITSGRRGVAAAERALHQHGVEPLAVLEADRAQRADMAETGFGVHRDRPDLS